MRQAEARVIQKPRRKINHKYRSQGYGQRVGIEPQGSRIQRRAVARVIRDYARRKGHLENGTRIRATCRDPTARQQDSASGSCQSHPRLRQAEGTLTKQHRDTGNI